MKEHSAFWEKHPGIVWSNRMAPDSALIRAALLNPRFYQILDIAAEFGLKRVADEWQILKTSGDSRVTHAAPSVERCLRNIEKGFQDAAAAA